jgi:hypothetical protein
MNEEF